MWKLGDGKLENYGNVPQVSSEKSPRRIDSGYPSLAGWLTLAAFILRIATNEAALSLRSLQGWASNLSLMGSGILTALRLQTGKAQPAGIFQPERLPCDIQTC